MTARSRSRAAAALLVLLQGCDAGGSETGNPVAARMGLEVRSEDPQLIGVGSGAGGAVLEQAWLAFGELILLGEGECAQLGEIDGAGPTVVAADLVRGDTVLEPELDAERYCGLALPLNRRSAELPAGAPAALANHSVVLRGRRADGVRFELLHSEQDALELAADAGTFAIEPATELWLSFDVAVWMNGVDLDGAQPGADGVIHVGVEQNRALLDRFELNLECSLELFADRDGVRGVGSEDERLAHCFAD